MKFLANPGNVECWCLRSLVAALLATQLLACGGGSGGGGSGDASNSASATITDKVVASVSISNGNNQSAIVGTELTNPLVALILNKSGQPLVGQIANFKVASGGGSVFAGSAISDSNGLARERWTLGTIAGQQKLEVRAVDSTGAAVVFASFDAVGIAAAPNTIKVTAGDGQTGVQMQANPSPIRVKVTDTYGNPVIGISVAFAANDGGSMAPGIATTNATGEAEATWTLGPLTGVQSMSAFVSGLPSLVLGATAYSALPRLAKLSGDLQTTAQYSSLSQPLQVLLTNAFGTPIADDVTFSTKTAGGYISVLNTRSDASGKASADPGFFRDAIRGASGLYFSGIGQQNIDVSSLLGKTVFTINVASNTHGYDGIYKCGSTDTIFISGSKVVVLNNFGGSGTFDESTGKLNIISSGNAVSYPLRYGSGVVLVDALGRATVNGTVTYDAAFGVPPAAWSCVRQI